MRIPLLKYYISVLFIVLLLNMSSSVGAQCVIDTDCGLCEKCVATVCEFQTTSEDTKGECSDLSVQQDFVMVQGHVDLSRQARNAGHRQEHVI